MLQYLGFTRSNTKAIRYGGRYTESSSSSLNYQPNISYVFPSSIVHTPCLGTDSTSSAKKKKPSHRRIDDVIINPGHAIEDEKKRRRTAYRPTMLDQTPLLSALFGDHSFACFLPARLIALQRAKNIEPDATPTSPVLIDRGISYSGYTKGLGVETSVCLQATGKEIVGRDGSLAHRTGLRSGLFSFGRRLARMTVVQVCTESRRSDAFCSCAAVVHDVLFFCMGS
jgi:hypothetical protein